MCAIIYYGLELDCASTQPSMQNDTQAQKKGEENQNVTRLESSSQLAWFGKRLVLVQTVNERKVKN